MCLTLCHVRRVLYDSDTDEVCGVCIHNQPDPSRSCDTCRHRRGGRCGLTQAPRPAGGWCCHCNAVPLLGTLDVGEDTVRGAVRFYGLGRLLMLYDVDWERTDGDATYSVAIASLALPLTYGIPTVHWAEEAVLDAGGDVATCDAQLSPNAYRFVL
jgi:hypothetical protein